MKRFWGNVILIALAHLALIGALIRWSAAASAPPSLENIMWVGDAADLSADESETGESQSAKQSPAENVSSPPEQAETADESPVATIVKSEIELPPATPKPTATATPVMRTATPPPKAKVTPKPIPKVRLSKTTSAKASPKMTPKPKSRLRKANSKTEKKDQITLAKKDSVSPRGNGRSGSPGKSGSAGGESSASEFGWYGNMLHDRFYSAWIQPTMKVPSDTKLSTLVNVRIEKDGRISKFEIAKASANATVNESVAAVAKQVSQVDPPPTGLSRGDHYDVKINFELNTEQADANR